MNTANVSPLVGQWNLEEIRYSFVWEDYQLPSQQLREKSGSLEHILCISSSGENGLNLLAEHDVSLCLIDLSLAQVALTELKVFALRQLKHEEFVTLFYQGHPQSRIELYRELSAQLSRPVREYWQANTSLIERGLLEQGRLEKYFSEFRQLVLPQIWSVDDFSALVSSKSIPEQLQNWSKGDMQKLGALATEFFSAEALAEKGRHASQFKYVTEKNTGSHFLKRFIQLISTELISENPYLYLFLTGKILENSSSYSLWNATDYAVIQERSEQIQIVHGDLESGLAKDKQNYDFMLLSDVFEYLSPGQSDDLFKLCHSRLKSQGELGYWSLLVDRLPPVENFAIKEVQSKRLSQVDRTWFYSGYTAALAK